MTTPLATSDNRPAALVPRVIGLIVFCVGILLIGYVFSSANGLLSAPPPTLPKPTSIASPTAGAATTAALELGRSLTDTVQKLLVLLAMCIVGAILASLGISLYFRAQNAANDIKQAAKEVAGPNAPP